MKTIKKIKREAAMNELISDYAEFVLEEVKHGNYNFLFDLVKTKYVEMENDEIKEHYAHYFGEDLEALEIEE